MATKPPPSSILILGTGAFGLSAAYVFLQRPRYANTNFILVSPEVSSIPTASQARTASVDNTRIIRADYANPLYHSLGQEAQKRWREHEWGRDGRYKEPGLLLAAGHDSAHGTAYIAKSLRNVQQTRGANVQELRNKQDIEAAMRAPGAVCGSGDTGYINHSSGWADAEACMRWLHGQVVTLAGRHGRVRFVQGQATRLLHEPASARIRGAQLASGETLTADVTVLATGAWTPMLLDMRGVASCRAQTMAYFPVESLEAAALRDIPVHLNVGTGCFLFPPTKRRPAAAAAGDANRNLDASCDEWEIKVAWHAYGYTNCTTIAAPVGAPSDDKEIKVSLPTFPPSGIPQVDKDRLTDFLHSTVPLLSRADGRQGQKRKLAWSRLCHYLDTPNGDFLVCFHPSFQSSLFLATGGSGHAFKFLPVLGDKIVDVFEERWSSSSDPGHLQNGNTNDVSVLAKAWEWPSARQREDEVCCQDGSRSGEIGCELGKVCSLESDLT